MYTDKECADFNKLLKLFKTHLQKSSRYEITFSPFYGCICVYEDHDEVFSQLLTPEALCKILFHEIAVSILIERHSRTRSPSRASKADKSAIRKRLSPYLRQLPEYRHLLGEILSE